MRDAKPVEHGPDERRGLARISWWINTLNPKKLAKQFENFVAIFVDRPAKLGFEFGRNIRHGPLPVTRVPNRPRSTPSAMSAAQGLNHGAGKL
jgi:hypothetical protein